MPKATNPSWLDYTTWLQLGIKNAGVFTLPDGCRVAVINKREDVSFQDAVGRGGVHYFRSNEAPLSMRLTWVESKDGNPIFGGGTTNDNYPGETKSVEQWKQFAGIIPNGPLEIDEIQEGEWRAQTTSQQYIEFKRRRKELNPSGELYYCYGGFAMPHSHGWKLQGVYRGPMDSYYTSRVTSQSAARSAMNDFFGTLHPIGVLPNIKYYPERFNTGAEYYEIVWRTEHVLTGMGAGGICAYVSSGLVESLPDTVEHTSQRPDADSHIEIYAARRVASPAGTVKSAAHPNWDLDQQLAMYFAIGLVRGKRIIAWHDMSRLGVDPNTIYRMSEGDVTKVFWEPDAGGTPPPYAPNGGKGYPAERHNWYDMIYLACDYYRQCGRTAGQAWRYLRYRVGNGNWVEPLNDGADNNRNAEANRGDCMGRTASGFADFYYYNPVLGKNQTETVTVEVGGKQFTNALQGGRLHVFNETI